MIALLAAFFFAVPSSAAERAVSTDVYVVDSFSKETEANGFPKGWEPMTFRPVLRRTAYAVESEGDNYFAAAHSTAADTGILKHIDLSIESYPVLSWRWKIDHVVKGADITRRDADDYAARVYVAFRYDPKRSGMFERWKYRAAKVKFGEFPPKAALIYVWDNNHPIGSIYDNAFTDHAKMIVAESGDGLAGKWVEEKHDVYADYKKTFGGDPPPIDFVALMTDTDQTGEATSAWYDDIVFKRREEKSQATAR